MKILEKFLCLRFVNILLPSFKLRSCWPKIIFLLECILHWIFWRKRSGNQGELLYYKHKSKTKYLPFFSNIIFQKSLLLILTTIILLFLLMFSNWTLELLFLLNLLLFLSSPKHVRRLLVSFSNTWRIVTSSYFLKKGNNKNKKGWQQEGKKTGRGNHRGK